MKQFFQFNKIFFPIVIFLTVIGCSSLVFAQASLTFQFNITPDVHRSLPRSPQIALSTDRGEGGFYLVGEKVNLRYQATVGGYINLAQYNPGGSTQLLVQNKFVQPNAPQMVQFTAKEPTGTHRIVVLLTPDTVPRTKIQDFLRNPNRAQILFGKQYAINRSEFVIDGGQVEPILLVQPIKFTLKTNDSIPFIISMHDYSGRPISGKTLMLDVPVGSLSSHQVRTNSKGMATFTYYASDKKRSSVRISVLFPGDADYGWVNTEVVGNIR